MLEMRDGSQCYDYLKHKLVDYYGTNVFFDQHLAGQTKSCVLQRCQHSSQESKNHKKNKQMRQPKL